MIMKAGTWLLLALLPAYGSAQTLTAAERARALQELNASEAAFLHAINNLTDTQWNFKSARGSWSIAQCAEHIVLSEGDLLDLIEKLAASPFVPTKGGRRADDVVVAQVRDRSKKYKAPQELLPENRWPDRNALIAEFEARRARTTAFVRTTQQDLRLRFKPHPVYGTLDAYQWILLLSAHTDRHTAQIQEIKKAPGYPR